MTKQIVITLKPISERHDEANHASIRIDVYANPDCRIVGHCEPHRCQDIGGHGEYENQKAATAASSEWLFGNYGWVVDQLIENIKNA